MKKKIFVFLLGAIFTVMSGAAVFSTFEAKADEPGFFYHFVPIADDDPETWCHQNGSNCFTDIIITPDDPQ